MNPLVLTLALDDATQARFDAERRELFPSGRLSVGAHLTLFHAVPGTREAGVRDDLREVVQGPPVAVRVDGVMALGRGAAYTVAAPEVRALHGRLQQRWWDDLTPQDQQTLKAHVTVQNKVSPLVAAATVERLRAAFTPFDGTAVGVDLWRYDGGPWTFLDRFAYPG